MSDRQPSAAARAVRRLSLFALLESSGGVGCSNPFTSGFLSIVHSSGIEFLLGERIRGLSP